MTDNRRLVPNFVGTFDDLMTFLGGHKDRIFYINLNPEDPPEGARQIFLTAIKPEEAERVLPLIHTGPPPRFTPSARAVLPNVELTDSLACGIQIDPRNPLGSPDPAMLKGAKWVRFPFYSPAHYWTMDAAFNFYDPLINAYLKQRTNVILVLNHQTYGEGEGYSFNADMGSGRWAEFTSRFIPVAEQIIRHYGDKVAAYEIWNEGDVQNNVASIYVPPASFAPLLTGTAAKVRQVAPRSKVIFGGLVNSVDKSIQYVKDVRAAAGGQLPVDAIGVHPYGFGAPGDSTPFSQIGSIEFLLNSYKAAFPNMQLWFTEMGATGNNAPQYWSAAGQYMKNMYTFLKSRADHVPVAIWYAWSDGMHSEQRVNGLVTAEQKPKPEVYDTFFKVACSG